MLRTPCYLIVFCNKPVKDYIIDYRQKLGLSHLTQVIHVEFDDTWGGKELFNTIKKNRSTY
jgi:hypothetical protein